MKNSPYKLLLYIFLLIMLSGYCSLQAQQAATDSETERVYKVTEPMPEFTGGRQALMKFLKDNIQYPAGKECIGGRVVIQFYVEKDGSLTDVKVAKSLDSIFDAEAVRVIKLMPKWIPASKRNWAMRSQFTLPISFAPDKKKCKETVYKVVEQMPEFPGGRKALMGFIKENLKYPNTDACMEGRVIVTFTVKKDGSLSDIKVHRSLDPIFDAEAIRVVELMPKWNPGKIKGKLVDVQYALPISFKLSDYTSSSASSDTIYTEVDEMPSFPEGNQALMKFLVDNIKYDNKDILCMHIQGKVIVQFVVEKDGSLSNIRVIRSLESVYDNEAMRVVELMPKWNPGKQKGVEVRTYFTLPITFRGPY